MDNKEIMQQAIGEVEREFEIANQMAKRLMDEFNMLMIKELDTIEVKDMGLFQAKLYEIISAFMLSGVINILRSKKLPEKLINLLCENMIEMAIDYAARGKMIKIGEH